MAEEQTQTTKGEERRSAPAAPKTEALAEMVNAANAFAAIQQQAALEAMKLPERRLDDASENGGAPGYILRPAGTDADGNPQYVRVDANGNEIGKASRADLRGA
jgi:hypothetical protein